MYYIDEELSEIIIISCLSLHLAILFVSGWAL